jgi:hypothetical protein
MNIHYIFKLINSFYLINLSASEDKDIDIPIGPRVGHTTLAKSLPVTVPAFHSYSHRSLQDDDEEQVSV